eukprot:6336845-Ditylum_brightwellii.AAC.1
MMIPRDPGFVDDGNSSLFAAGGFQTQLQFWWHLEWPENIQARNINKMKTDKIGKLISMSGLEHNNVIINYMASIASIQGIRNRGLLHQPHVLVLIKADNTVSKSWDIKPHAH